MVSSASHPTKEHQQYLMDNNNNPPSGEFTCSDSNVDSHPELSSVASLRSLASVGVRKEPRRKWGKKKRTPGPVSKWRKNKTQTTEDGELIRPDPSKRRARRHDGSHFLYLR